MATYYWVGGSGTWNNVSNTNWSASSGGAGGAGVPNNTDTVIFDTNSGTAATVDVTATATCLNGTVNKSDINLSLSGSPTFAGTLTLTTGTITLNSYTLTVKVFSSNNTNTRTLAFGTGKIVLTGNAARILDMGNVTGVTTTGNKDIEANYSGGTGTREIFFGPNGGGSEANAVSVAVTAGTDIVTVVQNLKNLNFAGFSGTLSVNSRTIYGNLTFSAGMTVNAGTNVTTFAGTSGIQQITSNGKILDFPVTFNGVGGTFRFEDAFAIGATRTMTLANGTLNGNDKNVSVGAFSLSSGTKTLTLGSGTWSCAGTWNTNTNVANLTVSASTGTISMTSASAKTFSGGAKVWPTLNQGGAGNLTIAQSNTFANITNTTQPATVRLTAGTTQTVSALGIAGTSGNLITLDTTVAGTKATIYKATGSVSLSFVSIKDIAATGGANFNAFTSNGCVDGGNNSGWDFNSVLYPTIYTVRKTKRYFLN